MKLILASQSPRRREILQNLGVEFTVVTSDADETCALTDPAALVEELSLRKAGAVAGKLTASGLLTPDTVILASDTVVSIDGLILGKPKGRDDARRMLRLLSGREHSVTSGVCLMGAGKTAVSHETTLVAFDPLTDAQIEDYIDRVSPYDKAGAYAIQGLASSMIPGIRGDYFNVVGLPVYRLCVLFEQTFGEKLL